ncbi:hypothetical protein O3M35_012016 [Rhynocoris fuscipes]|uniref:Uncharacterized protein n=1 Tax=Rhynocoris fuscipes TaxID=488301 RepID=A0AAW1CRP9_9HEMI
MSNTSEPTTGRYVSIVDLTSTSECLSDGSTESGVCLEDENTTPVSAVTLIRLEGRPPVSYDEDHEGDKEDNDDEEEEEDDDEEEEEEEEEADDDDDEDQSSEGNKLDQLLNGGASDHEVL